MPANVVLETLLCGVATELLPTEPPPKPPCALFPIAFPIAFKAMPAAIAANPAPIAAGVALNAIGAVISQKAGGSIGGGSVGSNSVATPQSNVSSSTFAGNGDNEVVFRISGNDLLGVLRRAENSNARLG